MDQLFDALLVPTRKLFEWILSWLSMVNIEPSMWVIQLISCVVLGVAFWYAVRRQKACDPKDVTRHAWTAGASILGLVGVSILGDWGVQLAYPLPGEIDGQIAAQSSSTGENPLVECHVELQDFRNRRVIQGSGKPSTEDGTFHLKYRPEFGNPPRRIVVVAAGRDSIIQPVTRRELRSRQPFRFTLAP